VHRPAAGQPSTGRVGAAVAVRTGLVNVGVGPGGEGERILASLPLVPPLIDVRILRRARMPVVKSNVSCPRPPGSLVRSGRADCASTVLGTSRTGRPHPLESVQRVVEAYAALGQAGRGGVSWRLRFSSLQLAVMGPLQRNRRTESGGLRSPRKTSCVIHEGPAGVKGMVRGLLTCGPGREARKVVTAEMVGVLGPWPPD
jgi:hypothetical protein